MKAVMYGGGNIGRGFIGYLFSASGYRVCFVDVADAVVNTLNQTGSYPVRILSNSGTQDVSVENVCAINGKDCEAVAEAIAEADIMATAVGVSILKHIIPNIVLGLRKRKAQGCGPLNILICENLMDANKIVEAMIKAQLNEDEIAWFDENIGLVETSIGRMVPVQTEQMKDGDPMRVCVERYGYLPVDKAAFKGALPEIQNMIPFAPFDFYLKRKLYIHNMGHATCAYLGGCLNMEYIYQAIDIEEIYVIVRGAMEASARALTKAYGTPLEETLLHITDLLHRFTNAALQDTCQRVGGDPKRKLGPDDRLIGACTLAMKMGICPAYIAIGAAAGIHRYLTEAEDLQPCLSNAKQILTEVCRLEEGSELGQMILSFYGDILSGATLKQLRRKADRLVASTLQNVI